MCIRDRYKPVYKTLEAPNTEFKDLLDVAKQALAHEKEVTKRIHEIAKAAREEGDERVISFIRWYVDEQIEEEDTFNKLITRLERIDVYKRQFVWNVYSFDNYYSNTSSFWGNEFI